MFGNLEECFQESKAMQSNKIVARDECSYEIKNLAIILVQISMQLAIHEKESGILQN